MTVLDISLAPGPAGPLWPGDPPPALTAVCRLAHGDECNLSAWSGSLHAGTHVDAPWHYLPDGATVEALDLDRLLGPCQVVDCGSASAISAELLARLDLPADAQRLLLRTANSARRAAGETAFRPDFVALGREAARWLVARGVRLVGIDGPSIAPLKDLAEPHRLLLAAGVVIIENLDLSRADPGAWELLCLPLALAGADGAPARAVLRRPGP
jgi:arylformamidase